jgi:hypothetical protein
LLLGERWFLDRGGGLLLFHQSIPFPFQFREHDANVFQAIDGGIGDSAPPSF